MRDDQPAAEQREEPAGQGGRHEQHGQQVDQAPVALGDGVVEQRAHHEGVGQPGQGAGDDRGQEADDLPAVAGHVPPHPPHQAALELPPLDPLGIAVGQALPVHTCASTGSVTVRIPVPTACRAVGSRPPGLRCGGPGRTGRAKGFEGDEMDVDALIDPEVAELLRSMPRFGAFTHEQLPKMRELRRAEVAAYRLSDAVERTTSWCRAGRRTRPGVRVHRPKGREGPLPTIYFMHGGGYVLGTYDDGRPPLRPRGARARTAWASRSSTAWPPRRPYPGPLEDCYAGLRWVYENADDLGIDPARLGHRRGIRRAAGSPPASALLARDRGEVPLAFQLPDLPDDRRPAWPRRRTSGRCRCGRRGPTGPAGRAYLGDLVGGDVPPYAAAARATDLAGLPPGARHRWVPSTASWTRTSTTPCGSTTPVVPTELHVYPGGPHGFDARTPGTTLARRARKMMEDWLARTMHSEPARVYGRARSPASATRRRSARWGVRSADS